MKKVAVIFAVLFILPGAVRAENLSGDTIKKNPDGTTEITMSVMDAVKMAGAMVDNGNLDTAEEILTAIPKMAGPLEIERWFLLGRIAGFRGNFDEAIEIYRTILDAHPDLARVRFELAICYMKTEQWYRADYQLRLAMAGDDLTDNVRQMMNYYRYVIRQNKNWNVYFNFGAAPDNNVNNATGGEECVMTIFGPMCRNLIEPESAVGFNFSLGGDYEFKLSDQWRWKSDAGVYSNIYNLHDYDDVFLYTSTGPRFIWSRGDVWLAAIGARRWYGWDGYNWSVGARLNANYDFTRKLMGGISLQYTNNKYDNYGKYLDGNTYSVGASLFYSITPNIYTILRGGIMREDARSDTYSYWQPNVSVGVGAELPYGFGIFVQPMFYWQNYDAEQWSVQDGNFTQIVERDFTQRYSLSVSNNKLSIMGFAPTLIFSYTRRDSNMWQREYDKWAIEFTLQQRF